MWSISAPNCFEIFTLMHHLTCMLLLLFLHEITKKHIAECWWWLLSLWSVHSLDPIRLMRVVYHRTHSFIFVVISEIHIRWYIGFGFRLFLLLGRFLSVAIAFSAFNAGIKPEQLAVGFNGGGIVRYFFRFFGEGLVFSEDAVERLAFFDLHQLNKYL